MKTGPTGRERYVHGLFGVCNVRSEMAEAEAAKPSLRIDSK